MATNLRKTDIPEEYLRVLDAAGVEIREIPFDSFRFRGDYLWALAFYKLCALKHFCSRDDWDCFCYMDSDVYCQANFDPIWKECERNILLYDINHGLQAEHYRRFCEEVREFGKNNELITHFGGEFFAASNKLGKEFCRRAEEIYREMIARDFVTTKGDEFILSLAAHSMRAHVKNAGAIRFLAAAGTLLHLPFNRDRLTKLTENYVVSNAKIKAALGIENLPVPVRAGIAETIAWFGSQKREK